MIFDLQLADAVSPSIRQLDRYLSDWGLTQASKMATKPTKWIVPSSVLLVETDTILFTYILLNSFKISFLGVRPHPYNKILK